MFQRAAERKKKDRPWPVLQVVDSRSCWCLRRLRVLLLESSGGMQAEVREAMERRQRSDGHDVQ